MDSSLQEAAASPACCPSLLSRASLPLPRLPPWEACITPPCRLPFCRYTHTHTLTIKAFHCLIAASKHRCALSRSRLTPHPAWKASSLSLTASPTTPRAQGTPSPCSQACTRSWAGSETQRRPLHSHSTLTPGPHAAPPRPAPQQQETRVALRP